MTGWSVDPVGGPWLAAAAVLALIPLLAIGPTRDLPRGKRVALTSLRGATLLLLITLGLRPALETTEIKQQPGTLLLMFDVSRSMQVEDSLGGASRYDAVRSVLDAAQQPLEDLAESWDLKAYAFDAETAIVDVKDGRVALPETPDGDQTAIGAALADVLAREAQQRIAAVLLWSDGAQRAFAPRDAAPQDAVRRLADDGVPLYTFATGKPALGERSDFRLSDLLTNDTVFADTPTTVEAMVSANGYANQPAKVQLLWEDAEGQMQTVDTRQVELNSRRRQQRVKLSYTPPEPGEYKVTMQIEAPEGEAVTANNRQSTFVTVLRGGVNVLYLAGATRVGGGPDIEPRFVRAALAAHADLNVDYEFLNYRKLRVDYRQRLRENMYDVFLLGDVDADALGRQSWKTIADQVDQGAGLAMLGGYHSFGPGGFRDSPIAPVLPIAIGPAERQNFGEKLRTDVHIAGPLQMAPVERDGQIHPLMQLSDNPSDDLEVWLELPAVYGANKLDRLRLRQNAMTVAWSGDQMRHPLLVLGAWGTGRTAALAVDSTWRWQMQGHGNVHRRFWRQLVLWLAQKDDASGRKVWVKLDGRRYQQGSRVDFTVGANDDAGEPLTDATFDVQVEIPDGRTEMVPTVRRGDDWVGSIPAATEPGDYRILVSARADNETHDTTSVRFTVSDQDVELDQPAAEPTLLANLANLTADAGGAGLAPEELPELLQRLKERTKEFEERIVEQTTLWDTWPMLLGFVGLLGTEWLLRKRWGLV